MNTIDPPPSFKEPEPQAPKGNAFLVLLTSHWLSIVGVVLVLSALSTWLFLLPLQMRGETDNPYLGLIAFVFVPLVLFGGLVLIPIGGFLARRRVRRRFREEIGKRAAWKRFGTAIVVAAVVNVAIGTQVTYRAVRHMETAQFCGSCHVMAPEMRTHEDSPHAQVKCAECHVGDGASGWVASKLNGARQFFENLSESFPRPIPSALTTDRLVEAKQTCEECHWRGKAGDVSVRVIDTFAEDEENSLTQTVLTMHVGGRVFGGIHGRHLDPNLEFTYAVTEPTRQDIAWVSVHDTRTGATTEYAKSGVTPEQVASLKKFSMQCIDCHNRPGHAFQLPGRALDQALSSGRLPTTLPSLKKIAMKLLQAEYASHEDAAQKIPAGLREAYQKDHADVASTRAEEIAAAGLVLVDLHNRNVYPDLKVTWGTYPDNIGHTDSKGCFRCHGGDHKTADGKKLIPNNCFTCHFTSALDEAEPEVLQTLGLEKVLSRVRKH